MRIDLARDPWLAATPRALPAPFEQAAVIDWVDGGVRVWHRRFHAWLDPFVARGRLWRDGGSAGLRTTLRAALCSRLPIAGGLPLHAAGIVVGGQALVFFGPSGAGKSTLAALARDPVLSDELIAVTPAQPFAASATSVWGTLGARGTPTQAFPLHALVELVKAPGMSLTRLDPASAFRRLIGVSMVPAGPPLWFRVLQNLELIAGTVPVWRMSWSPGALDWNQLVAALGD